MISVTLPFQRCLFVYILAVILLLFSVVQSMPMELKIPKVSTIRAATADEKVQYLGRAIGKYETCGISIFDQREEDVCKQEEMISIARGIILVTLNDQLFFINDDDGSEYFMSDKDFLEIYLMVTDPELAKCYSLWNALTDRVKKTEV